MRLLLALATSLLLVSRPSLVLGIGCTRCSLFGLLSIVLTIKFLDELLVVDVERRVVLDEFVVYFETDLVRLAEPHDIRAHFLQELRERWLY
jgi:hypothetical protein